MSGTIERERGRHVFGGNAEGYDNARPDYPDWVFEALKAGSLREGATIFEIGAGTGQATQRLLDERPAQLVAIEPDEALAARLANLRATDSTLTIEVRPFEDMDLPENGFDLGIAATAFHWLEPQGALEKIHRALCPGGTWAMWWNMFGDPDNPDAFHRATDELFSSLERTPSHSTETRKHVALEIEARRSELARAGFVDVRYLAKAWQMTQTSDQVTALAATFSPVLLLPDQPRSDFLEALRRIVDDEFGGKVERTILTVLYIARKPLPR